MERELDAMRGMKQRQIRIGAPYSLFECLLPAVVREFQDYFPDCEPVVVAGDSRELLPRLAAGDLDLAFGLRQASPDGKFFLPVFRDCMAFLVGPAHPWSDGEEPSAEAMAGMQYLLHARTAETGPMVADYFWKLRVKPRDPVVVGDMGSLSALLRTGHGVGIAAPWVARRELDAGRLVQVKVPGAPIERRWGIYTTDYREPSAVEQVFIELATFAAKLLG
ncbi:substrate-binding domain-containing protein [Luteolibacter flavescens]|uniref:Substrate-binding domain-containing protein n=1 Tax=Luteolibacter flavescens TaxID=1859460 RepID=A0ABT3FU57_9BACT|nr:substrate-binding domain-containing protein [Luteolibacter flavescens]MCW1887124.1 substrate-binding domain-containing protein [Luteolibacter flavescens]